MLVTHFNATVHNSINMFSKVPRQLMPLRKVENIEGKNWKGMIGWEEETLRKVENIEEKVRPGEQQHKETWGLAAAR